MAFGGGGSANYQANFILNTAQATGALQSLDKNVQRALGNVEKAASKAVSSQLSQMDRSIANMAGSTGNSAKTFKVLDNQGKMVTRTLYSMTQAQKGALSSTDKLRAKTLGFRDALADLKKSGNITTKSLGSLADNIDNVAFRAGAARGGQLKKLSAGIRSMSQDLADANAAANPPAAPATQPNLFQRIAARFTSRPQIQESTAGGSSGGPPRRTGTGYGGNPRYPNDGRVRVHEAMPRYSKEAANRLIQLGSAAQGSMIGIAALDRNITSLAFGLIFLSYGSLKTALTSAALTVALMGTNRAVRALTSASLAAGQAFEASGQAMANWFQSAKLAMQFKSENIQIAKSFGVSIDAIDQMRFSMEKIGLKGPAYIKAVLNASAAGNGTPEEIGARFAALSDVKTRPETRVRLVEQFAQDMNIPIKQYANSMEIADALNKRFAGSASAMAKTTQGALMTMRDTWQEFTINVGVMLNEYIKPVIDVATGFLQGMVDGFKDALKTDQATGKLKETVEGLQVSIRKLVPYLTMIGSILGRIIYRAAILAAQGLKVMADVIRAGLKWAKEYRDEFTATGTAFKKNFLDVVITAPTVLKGALAFLEGFGSTFLKAFGPKKVATEIDVSGVMVKGEEKIGLNIWEKIIKSVTTAPKALLTGLADGIKAGIIFALLEAFTLTAVDMLPVSDKLKKSLDGIVRMTFMGAALGTMLGPGGMLVGAILGAAIASGLELVSPGLSAKIMDWMDRTVLNGLKGAGKLIVDVIVPNLQVAGSAVADWIDSTAAPAFAKFQGWLQEKIVPAVTAFATETADKLMPKLKDLGNWLVNDGGPDLLGFSQRMGTNVLDSTQRVGSYISEKFSPVMGNLGDVIRTRVGPALLSLAGWFNENIMPGISAVGKFMWEKLIPAWVELHRFTAEMLLPVLQAAANLGISFLAGQINILITVLDFLWPALDQIVKVLGHMWDALVQAGKYVWDTFGPGLTNVGKILNDTVIPTVKTLIEKGIDILTGSMNTLATVIANPFDSMSSAVGTATSWVIRLWDWVVDLKNKITEISWPEPPSWVKSIWDFVSGGTPTGVFSQLPNENGSLAGGGGSRGFASGGLVRGYGFGDTVPIMASPGELILSAAQQRNVAARMNGGGGGVTIYMQVSDSVITNGAAMDAFTGMVASKIASRIGSAKSLTFHRI